MLRQSLNTERTATLILVAFALVLTSCNSGLRPQDVAAKTQNIVEDVRQNNDTVFEEIQRNINLVAELKSQVQEAQLKNETPSLKSVIRDIEAITKSYENLAAQKDSIKQGILQKVTKIERMRKTVQAEISILRQKQATYAEQLRMVSDTDPEIATARKKSLTKATDYVGAQIRLWLEFNNIQGDIASELSGIQQRIDSFLSMIESTAILFREGLNLLYLQQDISEALSLFTNDIPRMEQLTRDMEESWSNLDYLLETLTGIANLKITK